MLMAALGILGNHGRSSNVLSRCLGMRLYVSRNLEHRLLVSRYAAPNIETL